MDEIMHTCPWFHATQLPNCPPTNLVQIGIGGWQVPRLGVRQGRAMRSTILTIDDVEKIGIAKTIEIALETAWKGASAVFLSFDIDSVDAGFVPGTGWPEPGGFLPREALAILRGVAKEGIAGMEVVEVSPPYDLSDITALLAVRAMVDVLAMMVKHERIGGRLQPPA
jgi:agmatinase